jgi:hypothetical protein
MRKLSRAMLLRLPRRLLLLLLAVTLTATHSHARSFRVAQVPNGNVFSCATCHLSAGGGGALNVFGQAVGAITGSSSIPFWTAALATVDSDGDGFTNGEELGDPEGDFTVIPGAQVTRPGDAASFPSVPPPLLDAALLEIAGLAIQAGWTGGKEPFVVQLKPNLNSAAWINLLTTTNTTATFLQSGNTGFLRVGSRATTTVLPLTAWLAGTNEIPAVESQGLGLATLSLEGDTLTYFIPYSGLNSDAQSAHIHGPATSSENANVLHPLTGATGTSGTLEGTLTLSATDQNLLLTGRTYVNIHSSAHGSGEIRGQIAPVRWQAQLTGGAEVPPVTTAATGSASLELVGNQLLWRLAYANLTGPAQAAHLHGPAAPDENAPPLVTFTLPATTTGSAQGSATLDPATLRAVIDSRTYINIHTAQHATGEIRGQVQPTP